MSKFLKHVLVEQAELDRLRERQIRDYSPEINSMVKIKDQIDQTLLDRTLTPQQKLEVISSMQQRFDRLKADTNTLKGVSAGPPPTQEPAPRPKAVAKRRHVEIDEEVEPEADENSDGEEQNVIGPILNPLELGVAPEYQRKATALMRKISQNPDVIGRNEEGELVLNGEAVVNSNFNDLILSMFSRGSLPNQIGVSEMFRGLRQLRVTGAELVSSKFRELYMDPPRASSNKELNPFNLNLSPWRKTTSSKRKKVERELFTTPKGRSISLAPRREDQSGHGHPPGKRPTILYVY